MFQTHLLEPVQRAIESVVFLQQRTADFILFGQMVVILWMDKNLHHFETMVETIRFVGIFVGESNHSLGFLGWCEMDFAAIHSMSFFLGARLP